MSGTTNGMFPLETRADHTAVVPDTWPTADDLRGVQALVAQAAMRVQELNFVLTRHLGSFPQQTADAPRKLNAENYGNLVLYLQMMRHDGENIADEAKDIEQKLDEVLWEAVEVPQHA